MTHDSDKKHLDKMSALENRCRELENQVDELKKELQEKTSVVMAPHIRSFFEQSRDGVVVVDMKRQILDANKAYCDMLGYSLEELRLVGGLQKITAVKWRIWEQEEIGKKRLRNEGYSGIYEKEYIHKDGTLIPVEVQSYIGLDDEGKPSYLWAIVRDISERKANNLALREREEKLRSYFDNAPHGVFITNEKGEYMQVNPAACKMTGYSEEELLGMSIKDIIPPDQEKEAFQHFQQLIDQGYSDGELKYQCKVGEIRWWRIAAVSLSDNRFLGFTTDTTDRHKAEEKYTTLFNEMLNGFALHEIICDENGKPVDYRFLAANPAFERMIGCKASDIIGRRVLDVLPMTEDSWIETYGKVALTGEMVKFERYSSQLDEYFQVTAYQTSPGQFATIVEDITERKQAEKKLSDSEHLYQSFINTHEDLIFIKDENFKYVVANRAFLDLIDKERDEVIGISDDAIFPPQNVEICRQSDREALRLNKPIRNIEIINDRIFEAIKFPLKLREGSIGIGAIFHDITEDQKNVQMIERLNERFELAAMAANIGVWDHDVKENHLFWDKRMCELYGIYQNPTDRTFEDWSCCVHPDDLDAVMTKIMLSKQEVKPLDIEFRIIRPDESIRYLKGIGITLVDENNEPYRMTGINYDITDRKEMEIAITKRENYLNRIIHTTVDGFWIASNEGLFVEVNDAYCKMIGYTREELLTMRIEDIEASDDYDEIVRKAQEIIRDGSKIFESLQRRKDGRLIPVELSISYLEEQGGQFISFCRDLTERKKSEEALRQSETLARTVIENSPIGISVRSTTGQLLLYNQAWLDVWEMTPERLQKDLQERKALQLNERDEYFSDYQKEVRRVYREGGTYLIPEIETTGVRSISGKKRFLSQHFSGIRNEKGEVERVVILTTDITERKLAEEELRKSEERFRSYVENASDIVFAFNPDGTFSYISPNWIHFVGEPAENAIGQSFETYAHPDDLPRCYQYFQEIVTSLDKITNFEFRIRHRNGSYRWLVSSGARIKDKNGNIVSIVGIARDVTEAKKAEAERERLIAAIEQADETVVMMDQDGIIEYVNPAFEKVTGYSLKEAIGKRPTMLDGGEHSKEFYEEVWNTISSGHVWKGRFVNKKKNGTIFNEEASISPVRDMDGQTINYVAVKRDITRELELEQQFIQSQKMESVGRLAGGIAHDFNNMLLVILGHAELILDEAKHNKEMVDSVREIQHAAQHSADLTRQLLAFARKQTASPKILDINKTVEGMLKMLQRMIGESIELDWQPGADVSAIRLDPAQLAQILTNLAVNARDAIDGIGKITIETANIEIDEETCKNRSGCQPGKYVMLTFSDSGHGMNDETMKQIFEPFFTTKEVGEGTGLGLATVYGVIMQNHGHITVDSVVGQGTTFHIYLPAHSVNHIYTKSNLGRELPSGKAERILLVDDEPAILKMGRTMLERLGYNVIIAQGPTEAIEIASQYRESIDLLVTDVVMPEMNGADLARFLTEMNPKMKYLFMSGYTANVIAKQGIIEEDVRLLQKPFSFHDLATSVKETLEK